jgi:tRNA uridine 5-carbamoylmethylation protein Kti12
MLNVTITKGISGSGKTTWAKEQVKANPGSTVIVCKDDIRNMLWDGGYSKGREYLVKLCRNNLICAALSDGKHVISADTNFGTNEQEVRDVVADWAKANNAQVQIHVQDFTEVPLIVCITQDAQRAKPLGESVIREQYRRWICKDPVVLEQDQSLPLSIIVDLDGTLCHMHNRSPFEWHKVGEDYVDEIVAQIVKDYYSLGYEILLVSGRDGVCRAQTRSWLESNNIPRLP